MKNIERKCMPIKIEKLSAMQKEYILHQKINKTTIKLGLLELVKLRYLKAYKKNAKYALQTANRTVKKLTADQKILYSYMKTSPRKRVLKVAQLKQSIYHWAMEEGLVEEKGFFTRVITFLFGDTQAYFLTKEGKELASRLGASAHSSSLASILNEIEQSIEIDVEDLVEYVEEVIESSSNDSASSRSEDSNSSSSSSSDSSSDSGGSSD